MEDNNRMDNEQKAKFAKGLIIAIILIYWIAPDFVPGPIDDIRVTLLGVAYQKRITVNY